MAYRVDVRLCYTKRPWRIETMYATGTTGRTKCEQAKNTEGEQISVRLGYEWWVQGYQEPYYRRRTAVRHGYGRNRGVHSCCTPPVLRRGQPNPAHQTFVACAYSVRHGYGHSHFFRNGVFPASASINTHSRFIKKEIFGSWSQVSRNIKFSHRLRMTWR
jgi:hypothetical protein